MAQQKSQDAFIPLIEQLTNRAVYVMKRLTDISEKVLESRKKKWVEDLHSEANGPVGGSSLFTHSVEDIDRYPYFTYHVKELFFKFIDATAKISKEKCMDEFYSTRTIYWDLTSEYVFENRLVIDSWRSHQRPLSSSSSSSSISRYADRSLPLERNDQEDTKSAVVNLATDLFNELRDRITKNVLLKFYNFFLVPM